MRRRQHVTPFVSRESRFQPRQCNISVGQPQYEVRRFRHVSNFCTKHRYARSRAVQRRLTGVGVLEGVSSRRSVSSGPRPTRLWCKLPDTKHGPEVLRRHHW